MIIDPNQPKTVIGRWKIGGGDDMTLELVEFSMEDGSTAWGSRVFSDTFSVTSHLFDDEGEARKAGAHMLWRLREEEKEIKQLIDGYYWIYLRNSDTSDEIPF